MCTKSLELADKEKNWLVAAYQELRRGDGEVITNRHGGSPGGDENVLKLNRVCGGITLWIY